MEASANVHPDFRAGHPLVSVIAPIFNGERFLASTLLSIYLSYESPAVRMGILMKILKASIDRKRKLKPEE